jgi:hypothetical protein
MLYDVGEGTITLDIPMADRTTIPNELAAKVLYASDRTCCVCRTERYHLQIHHIDGDPTNHATPNLAVICLHCHSDAHSKGAFVRGLTPELVRLYNSSWRNIVRLKLDAAQDPRGQREYASEVYLETSLDCHSWKIFYMSLHYSDYGASRGLVFHDIWDAMIETCDHRYSVETWQHFRPLFEIASADVQRRFDRLIQLYADVLAYDFRTLLLRVHRQLDVERTVYLQTPGLLRMHKTQEQRDHMFRMRFTETLRILRTVAREADHRRDQIVGTSDDV